MVSEVEISIKRDAQLFVSVLPRNRCIVNAERRGTVSDYYWTPTFPKYERYCCRFLGIYLDPPDLKPSSQLFDGLLEVKVANVGSVPAYLGGGVLPPPPCGRRASLSPEEIRFIIYFH
ncbi:hypothetical protein EVAR_55688_1 [Eumeta japonica]|uniref:Uncharacterized protein n=1 Tax=Eumeta variegata TaxID=151549 RepID=A0A4C1Z8V0_EUMVA|nr:hypothetical protein EVAR_55688_1 [Eumeta japonica]